MAVEDVCSELHVSTTAKQAGRPGAACQPASRQMIFGAHFRHDRNLVCKPTQVLQVPYTTASFKSLLPAEFLHWRYHKALCGALQGIVARNQVISPAQSGRGRRIQETHSRQVYNAIPGTSVNQSSKSESRDILSRLNHRNILTSAMLPLQAVFDAGESTDWPLNFTLRNMRFRFTASKRPTGRHPISAFDGPVQPDQYEGMRDRHAIAACVLRKLGLGCRTCLDSVCQAQARGERNGMGSHV